MLKRNTAKSRYRIPVLLASILDREKLTGIFIMYPGITLVTKTKYLTSLSLENLHAI
jgi:hypothetical protein